MYKIKFLIKQYLKYFTQKVFLPLVYQRYRRKQIDEKYVILADSHHDDLPIELQLIEELLKKEGYIISYHIANYAGRGILSKIKVMSRFMKDYPRAKYVFVCDYFLPVSSCNKKRDTKVIQLWHAAGMFKKFGFDSEDDIPSSFRGNPARNFDFVTVSAKECINAFSGAFHVAKDKVLATGISRSDAYYDDRCIDRAREKVFRTYPEYRGKKLVLWAPTFRGNAGDPSVCGIESIHRLQQELGDDYKVIIKLHPHMEGKYGVSNCDLSTFYLLPFTDILITDYSSIIFDYSLFNRPAVLFAPDYRTYVTDRGFYLDYEKDLPYPIIEDPSQLKDTILQIDKIYDPDAAARFKERFMGACDGRSTARILKFLQTGSYD